ncbi:MAG: hypothetical protein L0G94_07770 [Brachybacterium sp.]|uniref:hypothetical protein n=1 Tax=Brachybacterium sp. TaxID=1891286 RepID=UPI002648FAB8|nr:hypothetical protein [Brachybacterium sp.]MDN5686568.1 hypothetical protein [Brachybacterium sp.]
MTAEIVVVAVLTVLCFVAGLTGGRRIAGSVIAPGILLLLAIIGNHSDIVSVPPGTAFFTTNGWLLGAFVFIFGMKKKSAQRESREDQDDQHASVGKSESLTESSQRTV